MYPFYETRVFLIVAIRKGFHPPSPSRGPDIRNGQRGRNGRSGNGIRVKWGQCDRRSDEELCGLSEGVCPETWTTGETGTVSWGRKPTGGFRTCVLVSCKGSERASTLLVHWFKCGYLVPVFTMDSVSLTRYLLRVL